MNVDLEVAWHLADAADRVTMRSWDSDGVPSVDKADGSPVTEADSAAERAVLDALRDACPGDGFLGEELGERPGTTGRRWIVDGIDGTRFFAAGATTWGTLIALQADGEIVVGVSSSPTQDRRWWAARGEGAFAGHSRDRVAASRLRVSSRSELSSDRVVVLPSFAGLTGHHQEAIRRLGGGEPVDRPWSHQCAVAEGEVDVCVWFCGEIWDHAAPSILVEEAGGRFSDHNGGRRLDTRTAVYSNGPNHDHVLAALR